MMETKDGARMKKYKLLRDLPGLKAGTLLLWDKERDMLISIGSRAYLCYGPTRHPDWLEEVRERWAPKEKDIFFWVSDDHRICSDKLPMGKYDGCLLRIGDCFRTSELAEAAAKAVKAELEKYHEETGE